VLAASEHGITMIRIIDAVSVDAYAHGQYGDIGLLLGNLIIGSTK
jgi:hypothetical protein